jgi:uncharacterized membrane protein YdbT with pleckstrin-like domain
MKLEYELKPNQLINFGWVMFGVVGLPFVIPPLIALYKLIYTYMWSYKFYEDIVIEQTGVFNITKKEINYFRIKSVKVEKPFLYRLFNLSIVHIYSSDPFQPHLKLVAIPIGDEIAKDIKDKAKQFRKKNKVRETDFKLL